MAASSKAASGINFGRIILQTNASCKVVSPTLCKVKLPGGVPYEAYNGQAFVRPWSLCKLLESTRGAAFSKTSPDDECFLSFGDIYKDYLVFMASTAVSINPELYDLSLVKAPLDVDVKLDYVGTSSFTLKTSMFASGFSKPLSEIHAQSVFVSTKTRLPAPPPDWWREKHSLGSDNGKPLKLARLTAPAEVNPVYQTEVPASDVDSYMHLNWSLPIKYCYNAYVHSELKKHGEEGAQNAFRNMKYFTMSFIKEANIGDKLEVQHWKDDTKPDAFNFQILKSSDVMTECNVEFY